MNQLKLKTIRKLSISAASGLLLLDDHFYVIADDELCLSIISKNSEEEISIRLLQGDLPEDHDLRKKLKPDFESLVYLPVLNSILVVPSGSKPNRCLGALVSDGLVQEINFEDLYLHLTELNPELNIEGSIILQNEMWLFSRGNGPIQKNFIIRLDLQNVFLELNNKILTRKSFKSIQACEIGEIQNHSLSFTDAAVENEDRIWFLAVAEGATSTYEDGAYLGGVLGCLNAIGDIIFRVELLSPTKPEGLSLDIVNRKMYIVTDADDRAQMAQLLSGDLPLIRGI